MTAIRYRVLELGSTDRFWEFTSAQHLEDYMRLKERLTLSRHRCLRCRARMIRMKQAAVPKGIPTLITCRNNDCPSAMYILDGNRLTHLPPEKYLEMRRAGL